MSNEAERASAPAESTPAALPVVVSDEKLISALDSNGIECDPEAAFAIRDIVCRLAAPPEPTMVLNYEPNKGNSFWHSDCTHRLGGFAREVWREAERSLMECANCGKRGYFSKGWVGKHTVPVVDSAAPAIEAAPRLACAACTRIAAARTLEPTKGPRLDVMVDRFLSWPVPVTCRPDGVNGSPDRIGTNLLSADEARQMLKHVIGEEMHKAAWWMYDLMERQLGSWLPKSSRPAIEDFLNVVRWSAQDKQHAEFGVFTAHDCVGAPSIPPAGSANPETAVLPDQECFPLLDPNIPEGGSRYPDKGCYLVGCPVHGGPPGSAAPTQVAAPAEPPRFCINGFQLRDALALAAPEGTDEQLQTEMVIKHGPARVIEGVTEAEGLFCWYSDYPDEGSIRLCATLDEYHADLAPDAEIPTPSAPMVPLADPMDWRLPCDVTVGHGTMRKGVPLRTLVNRMKVLYEMATGKNADEVANRTPEQNAALLDKFRAEVGAATQGEPK